MNGWGQAIQHPSAAPHRSHVVGADLPADTDDQRVAAAIAEVGDAGPPSDLGAAQHATGVVAQDGVDGLLLRREADVEVLCHGAQRGVPT